MSYARQPPRPGPRRGSRSKEIRASQPVRARAEAGELCWFYRQPGYEDCPGGFDWVLHKLYPNDPWAFSVHHLDRVMDGGPVIADPERMAPAHRHCNARDGLRAQNARRAGIHLVSGEIPERNSQPW